MTSTPDPRNEDKCSDRYFTKGETFLCQKPIGHGGWHESGDHEWQTVATSFCYMVPQQARDEICARLDEETAEQAIPPATPKYVRKERMRISEGIYGLARHVHDGNYYVKLRDVHDVIFAKGYR